MTLRTKIWAVLAASALLAGCGAKPWVDSRAEGGSLERVGESTLDRPAVCFADSTPMAEVQALAEHECQRTGRHAVAVGVERWQCRLVTPHRAVFQCQSAPGGGP